MWAERRQKRAERARERGSREKRAERRGRREGRRGRRERDAGGSTHRVREDVYDHLGQVVTLAPERPWDHAPASSAPSVQAVNTDCQTADLITKRKSPRALGDYHDGSL